MNREIIITIHIIGDASNISVEKPVDIYHPKYSAMGMNFKRLEEIARALMPADFDDKSFHVTFGLHGSKLLAVGINNKKTHTRNLRAPYLDRKKNRHVGDQIGTHSELSCIKKLPGEDLSHITFVNIRIGKSGVLRIAKPCAGCQFNFKQLGFKKVYYTTNDQTFELWD